MCHLFKSLLEFSSKKLSCYCHKKIDIIKCDSKANHCASKECWKRINGCWAKCPFFVLYSNCRPSNIILVMKFSATFFVWYKIISKQFYSFQRFQSFRPHFQTPFLGFYWKRINGCRAKYIVFVLYSNCRPPKTILVMKFSTTFFVWYRIIPKPF